MRIHRGLLTILIMTALLAFPLTACDSDSGDGGSGGDAGGAGQDATGGGGEDTGGGQVPGAEHPHWTGVTWETFLPMDGETAVYHVKTFAQVELDLTAHLERGVTWEGGTWDRIVAGDLEPGKDGMAIYLDLSEPWIVRAKGVEVYGSDYADGPSMIEKFAEPITIPLNAEAGVETEISTSIIGTYMGNEMEMAVDYAMQVETYDGTVDVPFGSLSGCTVFKAVLGGELMGDGTVDVEVIAHPEQRIVKWTDSPGFLLLELKEAWQ